MIIERKDFIVEYDNSISYIEDLVNYLETNLKDIMDFFELETLHSKKKIVIYNDLELYKKHIEQFYKYYDYMCADTNDGNINLLSIEEAHKTKEHANMTFEELKSSALHEFVHICQQELEKENIGHDIVWFWESLATNLGNPNQFSEIEILATNERIKEFISLPNNYLTAFTIGKYLLENYPYETILEYVKYPSKLFKDEEVILDAAREWSKSKNILKNNTK